MIADEIDYVSSMMDKAAEAEKKLYFFSAIPGTIQRVFNLEYDSDLVYLQVILQNTYTALTQRLHAVKSGDMVVPLSDIQLKHLIALVVELSDKIKNDESLDATLKKFGILAYSTTGNGYYLLQKGLLELKE